MSNNEGPWTIDELVARLASDPDHHHIIKTVARDNLGRPVLACPCGYAYIASWPHPPLPKGLKVIDK